MALIEKDIAFKIIENLVYSNKDNFGDVESVLKHFYGTGERTRELANKLDLDDKEADIAGLFHDIGRCFTKDKINHTFHEIIGARYFEEKAVELGITDSQEQCDRIAQSFRSHFVVYEQFGIQEYNKWLPGLRDTNPDLLLPKSWNELIIIYADLTNINGKKVDFEERINDIKERDKKNKNPRLKAFEKAESRLLIIKNDLECALKTKLTSKYNFL